jgi:hypothetical protein
MKRDDINFQNLIGYISSIANAKPSKPGEVPVPEKNPEIIPPSPSPVTWPEKEPEVQPEREPLTTPPSAPPEVPRPPQNESGILRF